jgi:enamine deaminase RidA (YjgF/YER057c/UK114 family)
MTPEERLVDLDLVLPAAPKLPPNVTIPFEWVRIHGDRCVVSGHGALDPGGAPSPPFGRVPSEVSFDDAQRSAHMAALAALAAIRRSVGSLDRIEAWLVVNAFVNADEGYPQTTAVVNPISELILDVFGAAVGAHARTAIGVRALPMNLPVVFTAELALAH